MNEETTKPEPKKRGRKPAVTADKVAKKVTHRKVVLKRSDSDKVNDLTKRIRSNEWYECVLVIGLDDLTTMILPKLAEDPDIEILVADSIPEQETSMMRLIQSFPYSLDRFEEIDVSTALSEQWADAIIFGTEESFKKYVAADSNLPELYEDIFVIEKL